MKFFVFFTTKRAWCIFITDQLPDGFKLRMLTPIDHITHISSMGLDTVNAYLSHPKVLELMSSGETFDICMFENFNAEAMMVGCGFECLQKYAWRKIWDKLVGLQRGQSNSKYKPVKILLQIQNLFLGSRWSLQLHFNNIHFPHSRNMDGRDDLQVSRYHFKINQFPL